MARRDLTVLNFSRVSFTTGDLSDHNELTHAFTGCAAVAHCAGINREIGQQTYARVHVAGTANVVTAARQAGVSKIVILSFLRARPSCGLPYHESKWAAEEIIRNSALDYTIFKAGMIYGRGDHMLDHLSHAFSTLPLLATVGFKQQPVRPLAIEDLVRAMTASLVDGRLSRQTVAITGAEQLLLSQAARRVAGAMNKRIFIFPMPVWFHVLLAHVCELTMRIPLVSQAQVRILSEGVIESWGHCETVPPDLQPLLAFTADQIRKGLPVPGPFGLGDLRCCLP